MPVQFRLFRLDASEGSAEVLNRFLRQYRVVRIERQFLLTPDPHVQVLVEYDIGRTDLRHEPTGQTDFEKAQSDRTAARYQALKAWRAALARKEGIPAFHILKNDEMDRIAGMESPSLSSLKAIAGFGEKRVERWGPQILAVLAECSEEPG